MIKLNRIMRKLWLSDKAGYNAAVIRLNLLPKRRPNKKGGYPRTLTESYEPTSPVLRFLLSLIILVAYPFFANIIAWTSLVAAIWTLFFPPPPVMGVIFLAGTLLSIWYLTVTKIFVSMLKKALSGIIFLNTRNL